MQHQILRSDSLDFYVAFDPGCESEATFIYDFITKHANSKKILSGVDACYVLKSIVFNVHKDDAFYVSPNHCSESEIRYLILQSIASSSPKNRKKYYLDTKFTKFIKDSLEILGERGKFLFTELEEIC